MCLFYALKLWYQKGGKLLIIIHSGGVHAMVCSPSGVFHGTTKGGSWHVEEVSLEAFTKRFNAK